MSSSVAPTMEAFTTRICLQAVNQYEKLLKMQLSKPTKNSRHKESNPKKKDSSTQTYKTINSFHQWRNKHNKSNNNDSNYCYCSDNVSDSSASTTQLDGFSFDVTKSEEDLSLKLLALNALELTAPASGILLKNRVNSWFQLSGHRDIFTRGTIPGTIWKRQTGGENTECSVYQELSRENSLNEYLPKYYRQVKYNGDTFIELQDLLCGFNDPHVIDIKLGFRTFSESEVSKTTARTDLYKKMIAVDPNGPTQLEHNAQAVTKLRYMQFREEQSSTCSHGYRIEAIKLPGGPPITDLKKVKDHKDVLKTFQIFFHKKDVCEKLIKRLKDLRFKIEHSEFFQTHEFIGSSIFMIYDDKKCGVWLIDFAKTFKLPEGKKLTHRLPWQIGNREEGILFGLDNLISTIEEIADSTD